MFVEPGNSNSTGKRKTVRVIGESFRKKFDQGKGKLVRVLEH